MNHEELKMLKGIATNLRSTLSTPDIDGRTTTIISESKDFKTTANIFKIKTPYPVQPPQAKPFAEKIDLLKEALQEFHLHTDIEIILKEKDKTNTVELKKIYRPASIVLEHLNSLF